MKATMAFSSSPVSFRFPSSSLLRFSVTSGAGQQFTPGDDDHVANRRLGGLRRVTGGGRSAQHGCQQKGPMAPDAFSCHPGCSPIATESLICRMATDRDAPDDSVSSKVRLPRYLPGIQGSMPGAAEPVDTAEAAD